MKCLLVLCVLLGVATAKIRPNKSKDNDIITIYNDIPGLERCGECNTDECERPSSCLTGTVKDRCGCCDVCGKKENELCHHDDVPARHGVFSGRCGDNLQCQIRDDVDDETEDNDMPIPEATCSCRVFGSLCGSDNRTYSNLCQLLAQGVSSGRNIAIMKQGACDEAPSIVSGPENVKDIPRKPVGLVCEARGYPIPTIEWTWTRVDGKTLILPSDDDRLSVNMRGGPEKWQVTAWLQISKLHKDHEGDYTCVAHNIHGTAEASARINVEMAKDAHKKTRRN